MACIRSLLLEEGRPIREWEQAFRLVTALEIELARDYLFPTWQPQSENIWFACFHSGAVLTRIGTYDLNFHSDRLSASTDFEPRIARNLHWIDRIGNHCPPDAKVIFGDPIACLRKLHFSALPETPSRKGAWQPDFT